MSPDDQELAAVGRRGVEMRPLWPDLVIGGLISWAVLLLLEHAGGSAVILPAVVAAGAFALLLAHRWWRHTKSGGELSR